MNLGPAKLASIRRVYNRLSSVEAAFSRFDGMQDTTRMLHGALAILVRHNANRRFGMFLLHRHFRCEASTVMVERKVVQRTRTLYVTEPVAYGPATASIAPHRFRLERSGELVPLEFSTAPAALSAWKWLSEASEMRRELGDFLARRGGASVLGLALFDARRLGARGTRTIANRRMFIEESHSLERKSVVWVQRASVHTGASIPTLWTADRLDLPKHGSRKTGRFAVDRRTRNGSYASRIARSITARSPRPFDPDGGTGGGTGGGGSDGGTDGGVSGCCTIRIGCKARCYHPEAGSGLGYCAHDQVPTDHIHCA